MARSLKIYIEAKKQNRYKIKNKRKVQGDYFLKGGSLSSKGGFQKKNFKSFCQVTGAARVYSQFAMSRHCLRKSACFGLLPGVQKASW